MTEFEEQVIGLLKRQNELLEVLVGKGTTEKQGPEAKSHIFFTNRRRWWKMTRDRTDRSEIDEFKREHLLPHADSYMMELEALDGKKRWMRGNFNVLIISEASDYVLSTILRGALKYENDDEWYPGEKKRLEYLKEEAEKRDWDLDNLPNG